MKSDKDYNQNVPSEIVREFIPAPWVSKAACRGVGVSLFFPQLDRGGNHLIHKNVIEKAQRVCGTCVVVKDCFAFALRSDEPYGVWGGAWFDVNKRVNEKRESNEARLTRLYAEHAVAVRRLSTYLHDVSRETSCDTVTK